MPRHFTVHPGFSAVKKLIDITSWLVRAKLHRRIAMDGSINIARDKL